MMIWLDEKEPYFPDPRQADQEAGGLLCAGGNLHTSTLIQAYSRGIFPWYSTGQPILWWSPDPRMVIVPTRLHISSSMKKWLKKTTLHSTWNHAFDAVIEQCAQSRSEQEGTWITQEMRQAYTQLHQAGHAHSLEIWQENTLVGGLYGVALGSLFFGESMFSHVTNASKMALIQLAQTETYQLIDCQFHTKHLETMGGCLISQEQYLYYVKKWGISLT